MQRFNFLPDKFVLFILVSVGLASFFPAQGEVSVGFKWLTNIAIALLFFMHGAKLSRENVIAGISHWRLHLLIFLCTFALFPLLGMLFKPAIVPLIGEDLSLGILYMCALPATVQSAIAFTSLARGNIPAAICSAAASSLLGIFITPLLVLWMMGSHGGQEGVSMLDAVYKIVVQLLIPFVAGQVMRRWIGGWVTRNKSALKYVDQSSILLVVYTAFSDAVNEGLWSQTPISHLVSLLLVCGIFLAVVLVLTWWIAKRLGFNIEDRITILFCGSKKSLATGVPMAQVLFSGGSIGMMILPVMLFHQIQLIVCAYLAQRFSRRQADEE